ncbi:hypothetical protein AXF42_Ash017809 [Apostasia shenzhenica]|uniref:Transposase-associated domain-containing protein n=1 Tax=Apostasia shenzhenica TaxID=1088818 RepID=A0A2I0A3U3_9ASPA|nr:hypothetical protein AXF42_Ash017809 [Apostasia shenzhenica]
MDKSWMSQPRWIQEYIDGVNSFLEFAFLRPSISGKILCPCSSFINRYFRSYEEVKDHLMIKEICRGYTVWNSHGEEKLIADTETELYPGCKLFSKLSFLLHLYRIKCLNSWTSKSFDILLELLIEALPDGSALPKNTYEVKKIIKASDLGYTKIHVCPNDC